MGAKKRKRAKHRRAPRGGAVSTAVQIAAGGALAVVGSYVLMQMKERRAAERRSRRLDEMLAEIQGQGEPQPQ